MPRKRNMYIEQKTDGRAPLHERGPAVIGEVTFNKSGKRIFYKGKTFQRVRGFNYNHRCLEDGNGYWISGVKKKGTDRHWAGGGEVEIDEDVKDRLEGYWAQQK